MKNKVTILVGGLVVVIIAVAGFNARQQHKHEVAQQQALAAKTQQANDAARKQTIERINSKLQKLSQQCDVDHKAYDSLPTAQKSKATSPVCEQMSQDELQELKIVK